MTSASEAIRAALRGHDPSGEQWSAITAPLEPQCIIAGAGSGKTAVMTARIVWLVEAGLARPSDVLGLTFTNKAAAELEERLGVAMSKVRPQPREHATVLTYHAFAAQIVREHGPRLGIAGDAALLSEAQKWQMLLGLVDRLPKLDALELRHPLSFIPQTLGLAEQCSHHLVDPSQLRAEPDPDDTDEKVRTAVARRRDFAAIVAEYTKAKRAAGRIDFGDQITIAVDLLRTFREVADAYRARYRVVLLDEYQDTNPAQKRLLQLLCPPGWAVTAVGDARQAIYAWRGATMFNLIRFAEDFERAREGGYEATSLAANYRSGRRIVALANAVISSVPVERRPGSELVATLDDSEVTASLFTDEDAEAEWIADRIEEWHDPPARPWREIAVLVRRKASADRIVRTLAARDIPFEMPEVGGLLRSPPVVDTVAWLHVVADPGPSTNRWAARILLGPAWRVHYGDLAPVSRWAAHRNAELTRDAAETLGVDEPDPGEIAFSLLEALEHAGEIDGVSGEARERIAEFLELRASLRTESSRPLAELSQLVADRTGIAATLAASPARSAGVQSNTLRSFIGVCSDFSPVAGEPTLTTFLDYLDAAEESDDAIPVPATAPTDSVKVLTVHAAKGLEFDVVFLPVLAAEQKTNNYGMRVRSVFPDVRITDPLRSAQSLPNSLRADAADLPQPRPGVTAAKYQMELRDRALEDERRLLYVAITRARLALHCTAAHWYGSDPAKGPSAFLEEIKPFADVLRWDEAPDENPVLKRMSSQLEWPPAPRAPVAVLEWLDRVDAIRAGTLSEQAVLALGGDEARALLESHVRELDALVQPADVPSRAVPRSLGATDAIRIAGGKTSIDAVLHPLPERASEAQRLGIEVHAWIEQRSRGLIGLADESAPDAPSLSPDAADVARLRANFVRMGFDGRPIATLDGTVPMVELPFTLKVGELLVRGRIDVVYERQDGVEVVDFKTGAQPEESDHGQLELYAEALAALGALDGPVTLTYAYLSTGESVSWTYEPRGLGWLEEQVSAVLVKRTS